MRRKRMAQRATVQAIKALVEKFAKKGMFFMVRDDQFSDPKFDETEFMSKINSKDGKLFLKHLEDFRDPARRLLIIKEVVDVLNNASKENETGLGLEYCLQRATCYENRKNWPKHNNDISAKKTFVPPDPDDDQSDDEFWEDDY